MTQRQSDATPQKKHAGERSVPVAKRPKNTEGNAKLRDVEKRREKEERTILRWDKGWQRNWGSWESAAAQPSTQEQESDGRIMAAFHVVREHLRQTTVLSERSARRTNAEQATTKKEDDANDKKEVRGGCRGRDTDQWHHQGHSRESSSAREAREDCESCLRHS